MTASPPESDVATVHESLHEHGLHVPAEPLPMPDWDAELARRIAQPIVRALSVLMLILAILGATLMVALLEVSEAIREHPGVVVNGVRPGPVPPCVADASCGRPASVAL